MNTHRPTHCDLTLHAACTLQQARALHRQLLDVQPSGSAVTIDGGGVEQIDTAGLQLLAAFVRLQQSAGRAVRWAGASEVLVRHGSRLGLTAALALPAAGGAGAAP